MDSLTIKEPTIDSREVAEMIDMRHTDLCRKIQHYINVMGQNAKLRFDDFFRETTYTAGTGKNYTRYDVTRKGCEMIANKLTGEKGILFTAAYVERFHQMEDTIKEPKKLKATPTDAAMQKKLEIQEMRAKTMLINANTRKAKVAAELIKSATLDSYKNALMATATNTLAGEKVVELPKSESGRKRHELGWYCEKVGRKRTWASQMSKELAKKGITKEDGKTGEFVETIDAGGHQRQNFEWFEDFLLPIVMINFKPEEKA